MDLFGNFGGPTQSVNINNNNSDPVTTFYRNLFSFYDKPNSGYIQGKQIFGFFVTSNVNKKVLADIWDESTQKQKGGLNLDKFIVAMKLIALAQNNIPPKRINLQSNGNILFPNMAYPQHIQPPSNINSNNNSINGNNNNNDVGIDPFGSLTTGLGLGNNNNNSANASKPTGPTVCLFIMFFLHAIFRISNMDIILYLYSGVISVMLYLIKIL